MTSPSLPFLKKQDNMTAMHNVYSVSDMMVTPLEVYVCTTDNSKLKKGLRLDGLLASSAMIFIPNFI
jgi:hypothetical protein